MFKIIEVKKKSDIKRFIDFPLELYEGCPYYVPMLYSDEKKIFKKNYVYNNTCDTVFYLCVDEKDKVVGRIEGIIQKAANEKWGQKRVRFTRFDCIDNQEVANLLFDEVIKWAKGHGMEEAVGPLGYSDLEREGLLIEGFDQYQTYEEQYNYEYYSKLIDNYGFVKEVDWIEYKVYPAKKVDERLERVADMMMKRNGLTILRPKRSIGAFVKKYKKEFFDIVDSTYNKIYGTVPFTKEMMESSISNFKLILRPQDIGLILDKNGKVCGFALMFPSISKVVTKYKGKMSLGFIIDFLKNKKNPDVLDLGLIGVLPEYTMQGIALVMIASMTRQLAELNIDHLETNLMLEDNQNILGLMEHFEKEYVKRRRCYVKKI